ncbi:hypothetical protein ACQ4PT_040583 [Festuca glaucescens]
MLAVGSRLPSPEARGERIVEAGDDGGCGVEVGDGGKRDRDRLTAASTASDRLTAASTASDRLTGLPMDSGRNEAQLPVQQHPELLMAAREGNAARLTHLLGNGRATQPGPAGSGVVVNIGDADTAMDALARPADAVGMDVAMDVELNKILHVIASTGDSPDFLESARVVYGKANHLLDACNANGDTPFHCAARAGMVEMVSELISLARTEGGGQRVKAVLGKLNKQGETTLHEALRLPYKETVVDMDPSRSIHSLLMVAGARYGAHSGNHDPVVLDEKEEKKIMDSTPTIGIVSALLVTVTFAASFTVPGGYRADDNPVSSHHSAGTPVLAATYSFQAFIIANNLALLCSSMATISLVYAGITTVDIGTRMCAFVLSIFFLNSSARSLAAAFAFGMYAALAPVAHAAVVVTWLITAASLLDVAWFVCALSISQLALLNRIPTRVCMLRSVAAFVCPLLGALWPYAIIAAGLSV